MKKLAILVSVIMSLAVGSAMAAESKPFVEIGGHLNAGWMFESMNDAAAAPYGSLMYQEGLKTPVVDPVKRKDSAFYLGDVMLSASKSFGDVAKVRAELLFGRLGSYSNKGFDLGQAYGTFNVKGIEFLLGRYIAPLGSESPYINENDLPFTSIISNFLLPHYLTGAKVAYDFGAFDAQIWAANDLRDEKIAKNRFPAFGGKFGFNLDPFMISIGGAASPEFDVEQNGTWTYLADLNASYAIMDNLSVSAEGVYRYDSAVDGEANKYYAGLGKVTYGFTDKWDGTIQYAFLRDAQGPFGGALMNTAPVSQMHIWGPGNSATGLQADFHEVALGGAYHLTDEAKLQAMYRLNVINTRDDSSARAYDQTFVFNLGYSF